MGHSTQRLSLLVFWSLGAAFLLLNRAPDFSRERSASPPASSLAFTVLLHADYVSLGPSGFAAVVPPPVLAWRVLIEDPQAPKLFEQLLQEATPAGQIYAMAGIFLLDTDAFGAALPRLRAQPAHLKWQDGCVLTDMTEEGAITWLQNGTVTHRLLGAAAAVYR